jgi:hypothetical protein
MFEVEILFGGFFAAKKIGTKSPAAFSAECQKY